MPEGHTIHRLARDHAKWFASQEIIVLSPQGRFAREARKISGMQLQSVEAYGKHLFYCFPGDCTLHVHLGLYGKFRLHKNPPPEPKGAVRVRMIGFERSLDLNGPNQCRLVDSAERTRLLDRLGPDPLREDSDPQIAWTRIQRSRSPIGALLLNQSVIAGVGNIYRAEILHVVKIHPERPGNQLSRAEFDELWELTVRWMKLGVRYNRIITVSRTQATKPLSRLGPRERLQIYKKPICGHCESEVHCWELGNRKIYACESCQS